MFRPQERQSLAEPSVAHRGAVLAVSLVKSAGEKEVRLLSCGVDGQIRLWDPCTGAPSRGGSSGSPFHELPVECWSKACSLQLVAQGSPEDVCLLPEKDKVSVRCLRTGELLYALAAHTNEVNCVAAGAA